MRKTLTADVINATTSFADITGLSFAVRAGKPTRFRFVIDYTCNATTTGSAFAINGTNATISRLSYAVKKTALSSPFVTFKEGISTYDGDAASADTATTGANIAIIEGVITTTTDGIITGRFLSEVAVAAGITVKAGSRVDYDD
jgi:hypothetical protein